MSASIGSRGNVRFGCSRRSRSSADTVLYRRNPSVSSSAAYQNVDRLLRRNLGDRPRNVAPHPDVFVSVAHEEGERVDDRFTVADEHRARASLQHAVSQQRDERRNENEVVGACRPDALHRLVRDFRRRIVKERNEQPPESRVGDVPDRDGDVAPRLSVRVARICCQIQQHALCSVYVGRRRACRQARLRRSCESADRGRSARAGQRRGVCLVDRRERAHRRGPDPRVRVSQRPSNLRDPLLGYVRC